MISVESRGGCGFAAPGRAPYAGYDMHHAPDQTVYLDHAATTPMLPAAVEAMTAHLGDVGNPSSLHASGRAARRIVEESRETIAQALNCRPGEVVFTSGGTEADNLALKERLGLIYCYCFSLTHRIAYSFRVVRRHPQCDQPHPC